MGNCGGGRTVGCGQWALKDKDVPCRHCVVPIVTPTPSSPARLRDNLPLESGSGKDWGAGTETTSEAEWQWEGGGQQWQDPRSHMTDLENGSPSGRVCWVGFCCRYCGGSSGRFPHLLSPENEAQTPNLQHQPPCGAGLGSRVGPDITPAGPLPLGTHRRPFRSTQSPELS